MATQRAVRWNIRVSKRTDRDVRRLLGPRKVRTGEMSKFVENLNESCLNSQDQTRHSKLCDSALTSPQPSASPPHPPAPLSPSPP
jgi:hypothetical protein